MTTSPIPLIYIAGPLAGSTNYYVQHNVADAERLALRVAQCGALPVCPHTMNRNFFGMLTEAFWLRGVMELLARCDGIALLGSWRVSTGAVREHDWAKEQVMPIFYEDENAMLRYSNQSLQAFVDEIRHRMQTRQDYQTLARIPQ